METNPPNIYPKTKYLWRYLDPYKLISFLNFPCLRFTRLDLFDDILEGYGTNSIALANLLQLSKHKLNNTKIENLQKIINNTTYIINQLHIEEQINYFALCFFSSDTESIPMWKTYGSKFGVALRFDSQATLDLILKEIQNKTNLEISFAPVKYLNISNPYESQHMEVPNNELNPFLKDSIYSYENEYRIVLRNTSKNDPVDPYLVPIQDLMDKIAVFTFPGIDDWEHMEIKELIKIYGYNNLRFTKSTVITKEIYKKLEKQVIYEALSKISERPNMS